MRNEWLLLNDTPRQRPIAKKLRMLCSLGFNNLDLNNGWRNANSGILVDSDGMGPDPVITNAIIHMSCPTDISQVRSFLGAVNFNASSSGRCIQFNNWKMIVPAFVNINPLHTAYCRQRWWALTLLGFDLIVEYITTDKFGYTTSWLVNNIRNQIKLLQNELQKT